MFVDLLAIVMILVIAGFYSQQGLFSALLSLIAAVFASILAMGLFEPLSGIIGGYKPEYARGATFLLVFFLAISACRFAADRAVPKNIHFEKKIDAIGGGVMGFFAAMVIVGTMAIGLGMLPFHTKLLAPSWADSMGFDRYPVATGMKLVDDAAPAGSPNVESPANIWLWPDRFTLTLWNGASGRGLGGARAFDSVHPDLTVESYGYRNRVEYGSNGVVPQKMLQGVVVHYIDDAAQLAPYQIPNPGGKRTVIARITVDKGESDSPDLTADTDNNFRISASQIRLVTDKGRQYYPIGDLHYPPSHPASPETFEPMDLTTGHLVDDYVGNKLVEDWVFQVDPDEKPAWLEVKQLARVDVTDQAGTNKPLAVLASSAYPKRAYKEQQASLTVTATGSGGPIAGAKVFLIPDTIKVSLVHGAVETAYDHIRDASGEIGSASGAWYANVGKPGVPTLGDLASVQNRSRNEIVDAVDPAQSNTEWSLVVPTMLDGAAKPDGATNYDELPRFFDSTIEPMIRTLNPTALQADGVSGADGKVELKNVRPGKYVIICSAKAAEGYYVWYQSVELKPKATDSVTLKRDQNSFYLQKP